MKAVFRREATELGNGATLWRWRLRTASGDVIDDSLPTAPTLQDGRIYFTTSENVEALGVAEFVAHVSDAVQGKRLTLYRITRDLCTVTLERAVEKTRPRVATRSIGHARPAESEPTP